MSSVDNINTPWFELIQNKNTQNQYPWGPDNEVGLEIRLKHTRERSLEMGTKYLHSRQTWCVKLSRIFAVNREDTTYMRIGLQTEWHCFLYKFIANIERSICTEIER